MQKERFFRIAAVTGLMRWRQASSEGWSPSAETDVRELIVTPKRPASPPHVTTATKVAARLMPSRELQAKFRFRGATPGQRSVAVLHRVLSCRIRHAGSGGSRQRPDETLKPSQSLAKAELRRRWIASRAWSGRNWPGTRLHIAVADDLRLRLDAFDDAGDTGRNRRGDRQIGTVSAPGRRFSTRSEPAS